MSLGRDEAFDDVGFMKNPDRWPGEAIERGENHWGLNPPKSRLELLEVFFLEICRLTVDHDVINDHAVVYPRDLGDALMRVDKEWWRNVPSE